MYGSYGSTTNSLFNFSPASFLGSTLDLFNSEFNIEAEPATYTPMPFFEKEFFPALLSAGQAYYSGLADALGLLAEALSDGQHSPTVPEEPEIPDATSTLRVASYNASLNRAETGELLADLSTPDDPQAQQIAEVIQQARPDVLLINEFDYSPEAVDAFRHNYLGISQNGADPIDYPYAFSAPVNTGVASGFDLDNDGRAVTMPDEEGYAEDALGFGQFPGQYGMLVLSRYPLVEEEIRTFQDFLWKDMPNARLPDDPATAAPADYYSEEELSGLPLSSKSHWDIPIVVDGQKIHLLASHPTPPTFDGPEDRNGLRNADEIRFWSDYVTPEQGDYIVDDQGHPGGLGENERFVIVGDQNVDPVDGDSLPGAAQQLLGNAYVDAGLAPDSRGAVEAAQAQGEANETHSGDARFDTADFNDTAPGNLRADYVLPSQSGLTRLDGGVFWPTDNQPGSEAIGASDHRLVYADLALTHLKPLVEDVEFVGMTEFSSGMSFQNTVVGGLSGLTYNSVTGEYLAIADDRSEIDPARFYSLRIDLDDGRLDEGDVYFTDVTTLRQSDGSRFSQGQVDPEGIALAPDGSLFISSEGDVSQNLSPSVWNSARDGEQLFSLPIPQALEPDLQGNEGIRNNLALESLTLTPDGKHLFTATENALVQDGPAADLNTGSPSRIIEYDLHSQQPEHEYLYPTEPIPERPANSGDFATNGLVEMLALDDHRLLTLERAFVTGIGNTIRLYEIDTSRATDIRDIDALTETNDTIRPVDKQLIVDLSDYEIVLDNVEGMALGPELADGRQSLILVSDDNFSDTQSTQFIALSLEFAALPECENLTHASGLATTGVGQTGWEWM
ncbi:esterase-like activity of phytase family protein [Halomonas sp. WWR20]